MARRIGALDGLRGVAILLVLAGHSGTDVFSFGGPVGVTLFFVLSGFLITRVIVSRQDTGSFSLKEFYVRRARRLFPALALLLIAALAIGILSDTGDQWWTQSWPAMAYVANLRLLTAGWESMGFLGHLWSLSVEEHFYLLWPVALLVIRPVHRERVTMILLLGAGLWRGYVLATTGDWNRVYLGTDTNAFALLVGCWLALAPRIKFPLGVSYAASAFLLGLASVTSGQHGSALLSFLGVAACGLAVKSLSEGNALFENKALRWFGTISYGLYLWQGLVFSLFPESFLLAASVSTFIAWLSWRFLESRWLYGEWAPAGRASVPAPQFISKSAA